MSMTPIHNAARRAAEKILDKLQGATYIPSPHQTEVITKLVQAEYLSLLQSADNLLEIVEGVRGERWTANGRRLVDTREWCAFYCEARQALEAIEK